MAPPDAAVVGAEDPEADGVDEVGAEPLPPLIDPLLPPVELGADAPPDPVLVSGEPAEPGPAAPLLLVLPVLPLLARGDASPGPEAPLLLVLPVLPLLARGDASPGPEAPLLLVLPALPLLPGVERPAGICPAQLGTAAKAPMAAVERARTSS